MKNKDVCGSGLSFEECELAILRQAVDNAEEISGKLAVNSPDIKQIFSIVENFIRTKKLIPYGGIAINAILPKTAQFYNRDIELPDFDFYSPNALKDTKELCDIYVKAGYIEVEGKPGVHHGTYKVFVNFIPVADITYIHKDIFNALKTDAIKVAGILYAPANFLRMAMYLELSRPYGDISRWEKVAKRIALLNKYYPLHGENCDIRDFQRELIRTNKEDVAIEDLIFDTLRTVFIDQGCVFFGGYAMSQYSRYMPKESQSKFKKAADFDVISEDPDPLIDILKERLADIGVKKIKVINRPAVGEIIAPHYQIIIGDEDTVAFIYGPTACHSYNTINIRGEQVKIATIDTMLSFYLAFLYSSRDYYDDSRILCMAQYLFQVQQHNRLQQHGLLKRFSINCYGHQKTLEELRSEKSEKYKELKGKRRSPEYEEYFLRYRPADKKDAKEEEKQKRVKTKRTKSKLGKRTRRRNNGFFF
jgi:hypothetical protein